MSVKIRSLLREVTLSSPPVEGWQDQALLVPVGATDEQVLAWATGFFSPEAVAELAEVLEREASGLRQHGP